MLELDEDGELMASARMQQEAMEMPTFEGAVRLQQLTTARSGRTSCAGGRRAAVGDCAGAAGRGGRGCHAWPRPCAEQGCRERVGRLLPADRDPETRGAAHSAGDSGPVRCEERTGGFCFRGVHTALGDRCGCGFAGSTAYARCKNAFRIGILKSNTPVRCAHVPVRPWGILHPGRCLSQAILWILAAP
eukprot:4831402-Prymnesium_polylepis.1